MIERDLKEIILALPPVRLIEMPDTDKQNAINKIFPLALDEVTLAYDWDFTLSIATESTVADQADYTLQGNKKDCRDIINLKYDGELIQKMGQVSFDNYMVGRTNTTSNIWIPKGVDNGFPEITIATTPSSADIEMEYRYRKKNITFADFPDEFDYVIISAVLKHFLPDYTAQFSYDMKTMIDRNEYGGGESNVMRQDPRIIRGNNSRATKFGYGG